MKGLLKPRNLIWLLMLLILWWALRDVPLTDIWSAMAGLRAWQILVLILFNTLIMLAFSGRWWLIMRAQGHRLPYLTLVGYRLASFGVSYFTPGPQFGGEPLQVLLTREKHDVPAATAIAAVTLDKILELIANFTFLVIGLVLLLEAGFLDGALPGWLLISLLALFATPGFYLVTLWMGARPLAFLLGRIPRRLAELPAFQALRESTLSAEAQIGGFCQRNPGTLFQAMLLSLFVWLAMVAEYWLTLRFLGLSLNLVDTISLLTIARSAFLLPSPGGLGTLEAAQVLAFQAFGLNPALGLSVSLLIRARDVAFGALGLWIGAVQSRRKSIEPLPNRAAD